MLSSRFARRAFVAVALLAAAPMLPASAAVRHCGPRVEASADAAAELAARQQALQRWVEGARRIGDGFTRWQLAAGRGIHCTRSPTGYLCRASGAPCTISQQPGRVPQELQPKKKGLDI